jgi:NTE family protein
MEEKFAFVLGGGGSHGALQVGALRAALEANLEPDFLIGTSIGAVNAAFLALHGFNHFSLLLLEQAWREAAHADFMPANPFWLSVNALMERTNSVNEQRVQRFFAQYGLTPDLRFGDLHGKRLYLVSADLTACEAEIFGTQPDQSVLKGILASCALPPWLSPQIEDEKFLVDGAFISNLPLEPAMRLGATRIAAFSLEEAFLGGKKRPFLARTIQIVVTRQRALEHMLAEARGIQVLHIRLAPPDDSPLWDFSQTDGRIEQGYQAARSIISAWQSSGSFEKAGRFTFPVR